MEDLIKKAAEDLIKAKYAIALTGAGISTECGIQILEGLMEFGPKILRRRWRPMQPMKIQSEPKGK